MADIEQIIARVGIEGAEEIVSALMQIGEIGKKIFEDIEKASGHGSSGLNKFIVGIGAASTAVITLGAAFAAFANKSNAAVINNEAIAKSAGITVGELKGVQAAFASVGISGERASYIIQREARATAQAWKEIKDQIKNAADEEEGASLKSADLRIKTLKDRAKYNQVLGGAGLDPAQQKQIEIEEASLKVRNDQLELSKQLKEEEKYNLSNVRLIAETIEKIGTVSKPAFGQASESINLANVEAKNLAITIKYMAGEGSNFNERMLKASEVIQKLHLDGEKANEVIQKLGLGLPRGAIGARLTELIGTGPEELKKYFAKGEGLEKAFPIDEKQAKKAQSAFAQLALTFDHISEYEFSRPNAGLEKLYRTLDASLSKSDGFLKGIVDGFDKITSGVSQVITKIREFEAQFKGAGETSAIAAGLVALKLSNILLSTEKIVGVMSGWGLRIGIVFIAVTQLANNWDKLNDKVKLFAIGTFTAVEALLILTRRYKDAALLAGGAALVIASQWGKATDKVKEHNEALSKAEKFKKSLEQSAGSQQSQNTGVGQGKSINFVFAPGHEPKEGSEAEKFKNNYQQGKFASETKGLGSGGSIHMVFAPGHEPKEEDHKEEDHKDEDEKDKTPQWVEELNKVLNGEPSWIGDLKNIFSKAFPDTVESKDKKQERDKNLVPLTDGISVNKNVTDALASAWEKVVFLAKKYFDLVGSNAAATEPMFTNAHFFGGVIQAFASGGTVKGPSGIDRVPAMLTAGEGVIRQPVMARLGEGFLNAINNMDFGLGMVMGGLVPSGAGLRMASGGVAPSTFSGSFNSDHNSTVNLHLDGRQIVSSVAKQAVNQRISSAGRKPDWYGIR